MLDLKAIVADVRNTLVSELGQGLLTLYLFGSTARGQYVPGRSDVDWLMVVDPNLPLATAREVFRPLWNRYASVLGHGPLVATPADLALHLALFPALHRALVADARRFIGLAML
jgi:predicted nucleotidyltransferase